MPFLPPNQQHQSTEGIWTRLTKHQKHEQLFNNCLTNQYTMLH